MTEYLEMNDEFIFPAPGHLLPTMPQKIYLIQNQDDMMVSYTKESEENVYLQRFSELNTNFNSNQTGIIETVEVFNIHIRRNRIRT